MRNITVGYAFCGSFCTIKKSLEALKELAPGGVLPVDAPFVCFPAVSLSRLQTVRFKNGGELFTSRLGGDLSPSVYRVYSDENVFLGLGEVAADETELLRVRRVI